MTGRGDRLGSSDLADRKDAMSEHEQREVPAHVKKALDEWVAHYKELLAFKETAQVRIAHLERQLSEAALADHLTETRNMVAPETIASVTAWANETFGKAMTWTQIMRAKTEFDELLNVDLGDANKMAEEAADVCICLYRVIGTLDPDAIDKKMAKNRARKWRVDGQGCAQHVGEE